MIDMDGPPHIALRELVSSSHRFGAPSSRRGNLRTVPMIGVPDALSNCGKGLLAMRPSFVCKGEACLAPTGGRDLAYGGAGPG